MEHVLLIGMLLISYSKHMLLGLYIIHVSINVGKSPKQYSGSEIITDGWDPWQRDAISTFLGDLKLIILKSTSTLDT